MSMVSNLAGIALLELARNQVMYTAISSLHHQQKTAMPLPAPDPDLRH